MESLSLPNERNCEGAAAPPEHPHSLEDRPFLTCLKNIIFSAGNTADNKRKTQYHDRCIYPALIG